MHPPTTTRPVLVVEDDPEFRDALRMLFEDELFQVETATNGREALAALQQNPTPHVVLLDLMMPVMDGRAVYQALAADPELRDNNCVIILSAARPALGEFPLANAVLSKPFSVLHLLDTVERACHPAE
jgi:CheY-like chemotaxis protein